MPGVRGFKRFTVSIHREHEEHARSVLARYSAVVEGSVDFSGQHLTFSLDYARCPDGEAGLVFDNIERDIARRP